MAVMNHLLSAHTGLVPVIATIKYANGAHLSAIWENTALVQ